MQIAQQTDACSEDARVAPASPIQGSHPATRSQRELRLLRDDAFQVARWRGAVKGSNRLGFCGLNSLGARYVETRISQAGASNTKGQTRNQGEDASLQYDNRCNAKDQTYDGPCGTVDSKRPKNPHDVNVPNAFASGQSRLWNKETPGRAWAPRRRLRVASVEQGDSGSGSQKETPGPRRQGAARRRDLHPPIL